MQMGRYPDIITYANVGDDRLRNLVVAESNFAFPTDIDHRPFGLFNLLTRTTMRASRSCEFDFVKLAGF